jgi:hypothetical protein
MCGLNPSRPPLRYIETKVENEIEDLVRGTGGKRDYPFAARFAKKGAKRGWIIFQSRDYLATVQSRGLFTDLSSFDHAD